MSQSITGVPSPQRVYQTEVTMVEWEFVRGAQFILRVEVWASGKMVASHETSIGVTGSVGCCGGPQGPTKVFQ